MRFRLSLIIFLSSPACPVSQAELDTRLDLNNSTHDPTPISMAIQVGKEIK